MSTAGIAARQLADYRARRPGMAFAEDLEISLDEAYAVQFEVARLREADGERAAGYKVGCTGPTVRRQFGMDGPISGLLWQGEVRESGAAVEAAAFDHLAIEGEVAVTIGADGAPAGLLPVIELHNYVFRGPRPTLAELVANNGIHAGVVRPPDPGRDWDPEVDETVRVFINGELREEGRMSLVPGGPAGSLTWLRQHLDGFGRGVSPGQLVLTGAPLSLIPVAAGDDIRVTAGALGEVSARVV